MMQQGCATPLALRAKHLFIETVPEESPRAGRRSFSAPGRVQTPTNIHRELDFIVHQREKVEAYLTRLANDALRLGSEAQELKRGVESWACTAGVSSDDWSGSDSQHHASADDSPALEEGSTEDDGEMTTLMICNLPCRYTEAKLTRILDNMGLQGLYDNIYIPGSRGRRNISGNLGYVFVNFVDRDAAVFASGAITGLRFSPTKVAAVKFARLQGTNAGERSRRR